ncbi:MAG: hypothetical protein JWL90_4064 [Chthoniobacteraceae bacterium]|nr:hypothetical protein [Chthoniobacteraceae bacterium]
MKPLPALLALAVFLAVIPRAGAAEPAWKIGEPVVSYWAGPGFPGGVALNDTEAVRLVEGGWNLVWASEKELAVAERHNLRALLTDPLLDPSSLDDPKRREALSALVDRVKGQKALYAYHLVDEPAAGAFPAIARLVEFLRERDPAHLAYINVLPIYANNEQFGVPGPIVEAYAEHLRLYMQTVKPGLLSYDHYQLRQTCDGQEYFPNLAMIRTAAQASGVPFMNIVQACNWVPGTAASPLSPRIPTPDELRYLAYTTLAYGAQAISYYVYGYPGHEGAMMRYEGAKGTPTPLYERAKSLNREFIAIAQELQPLQSTGVFHAGMIPPPTAELPADSTVTFDPPIAKIPYHPGDRVLGFLLGQFAKPGASQATHYVVVNLDYKTESTVGLKGPGTWEIFDPTTRQWGSSTPARVELKLPGGSGKLVRLVAPK